MTLYVTEYCFHQTKNFSGIVKKLHFGVKNLFLFFFFFFGNSRYLRIFWSGVAGAIDTFVAEHVANKLS